MGAEQEWEVPWVFNLLKLHNRFGIQCSSSVGELCNGDRREGLGWQQNAELVGKERQETESSKLQFQPSLTKSTDNRQLARDSPDNQPKELE